MAGSDAFVFTLPKDVLELNAACLLESRETSLDSGIRRVPMPRRLAAFYSPDDDLEHGSQVIPTGPSGFFLLYDPGFSPATQQREWEVKINTPTQVLEAIAGVFCPADNRRYFFFVSESNELLWYRYSSPFLHNGPSDPLLNSSIPLGPISPLPGSIVDMAAHYNGSQLEIAVLSAGGRLQIFRGSPWVASSWKDPAALWLVTEVALQFPTAKRVTISQGAGAGHIFVVTSSDVTEVYYYGSVIGSNPIAQFPFEILDVGSVFTPDDGIMHVVVATANPDQANTSRIYEVEFKPAEVPPSTRLLGGVIFTLDGLGVYLKPDLSQHIIMCETNPGFVATMWLSWGNRDLSNFQYGLWPNQQPP
jgi:hypothetical protein